MEEIKSEGKVEEKQEKAESLPEMQRKAEEKLEEKNEDAKAEEKEKTKREIARVNGKNLGVSKKQAMAVCKFIKGKIIKEAIKDLEEIILKKKALPMKGEIPHRKGMMSGRYPLNACKIFIMLLKSLHANADVNGIGEPYVSLAKANDASRPYRRFGSRRFKRTHVLLEAKQMKKQERWKKENS